MISVENKGRWRRVLEGREQQHDGRSFLQPCVALHITLQAFSICCCLINSKK